MNTPDNVARDASLDDALDSVAVAVGLGMDVPAVQGVIIHEGSFIPEEYSWHRHGEEYHTPACNSLASVRALLVNEALSQIFKVCSEDSRFTQRLLFREDKEYESLENYFTTASDDEVLKDYATHCSVEIHVWKTVIVGDIPQRISLQELTSEDGKPFL